MALLLFSNIFCGNDTMLTVHENGFSASQKLGVLKILKDQEGYAILTNNGVKKVHKHDVSQSLKKMNDKQLVHFLNSGYGIIKVNQFTNGEFKLDMHAHGNGGGAGGATIGVLVGKFTVSLVGHGTLHLIALCAGPAYVPTMAALELTAGPYIEAASVHAAAVCGVAGAVITGPA